MTKLNAATPDFLNALEAKLGPGCLRKASPADLSEPRGIWQGQAAAVAAPADLQEACTILAAAHEARVPIIPISGGTGLVGGQISHADMPAPVLLSSARLDKIRKMHPSENVMIAEAGVILANARAAAADADRLFPLMIASEGSCAIGGNLATNAGGMNVLRYGNTRDLVLGIEAALPDGTPFHGLNRLRKDNTGYDLRHLLIGAEGTLGFITAAALRLFARPVSRHVALLYVDGPKAALDLLNLAQSIAGEMVSIFELLSAEGFDFVSETMPDQSLPFATPPKWSALIELGASGGADGASIMDQIMASGIEAGLVSDGILAQSERQADALIALREAIPEANKRIGSISSHDVSLPLSEIAGFISLMPAKLAKIGEFRINCFGHLGDGNLHYNVYPPKGQTKAALAHLRDEVANLVHENVMALGGSFSAEHGVGRLKVDDLQRFGDPGKLEIMRRIKSALDPHGIMNPGAVLPQV